MNHVETGGDGRVEGSKGECGARANSERSGAHSSRIRGAEEGARIGDDSEAFERSLAEVPTVTWVREFVRNSIGGPESNREDPSFRERACRLIRKRIAVLDQSIAILDERMWTESEDVDVNSLHPIRRFGRQYGQGLLIAAVGTGAGALVGWVASLFGVADGVIDYAGYGFGFTCAGVLCVGIAHIRETALRMFPGALGTLGTAYKVTVAGLSRIWREHPIEENGAPAPRRFLEFRQRLETHREAFELLLREYET